MKAKKWIGIDIHKKQLTVCIITRKLRKHKVYERTSEGIQEFLREIDSDTLIGVESTTWTWDLVKKISDKAKEVFVLNTVKLKGMMDRLKKTDKSDSEQIATIIRRFHRDELSICHMRENKEAVVQGLLNQREQWVREKTKMKNHFRSSIEYWGLNLPKRYFKDLKKDSQWINESEMHENTKIMLLRSLGLIDELEEHIRFVNEKIKEMLDDNENYHVLQNEIKGIGPITAAYLVAKIGYIERFENPKKLTAYLGFAPRVNMSDGKGYNGHISKNATSGFLRVMVQAAWASVRFDKTMNAFYKRLKTRTGSSKAIIAVARKLIVAVFYEYKKKFYAET